MPHQSSKDLVKVQSNNGRLRLYWIYQGKPYYLYLGLPDGVVARNVAQSKARIIANDIITDNFDRTLNKYKPEDHRTDRWTAFELMQRFTESKRTRLDSQTLTKYKIITQHLQEVFNNKIASEIKEGLAERFKEFLLLRQKPITVRDRLSVLKSCWNWAIKQELIPEFNPWIETLRGLKVPQKARPKPFTKAECQAIIEGFRNHQHYNHYTDYVEFMLLTGCRPAEAIGLQWKHLSDDCSLMWIGETLVRGTRKGTKNQKTRHVKLSKRVQAILLNRRGDNWEPEGLVFPGPKGAPMNDNNFCKRVWKKVLESVGVSYRKPYTTRSTLISHWLQHGENPVVIAQSTGHDVKVLLDSYAGLVIHQPETPDFLS
ncbi:MAG: tyrosine-type recombinase/integrase [Scytonematopsis contorta HA4267-MV1]|jgi:integrase|nr:tyrosine-type recombinase/integrase [Scytonematopsis contorta HA4267-MV1]